MFAPNPRSRSHSQSFPAGTYRASEYYLPNGMANQVPNIASSAAPRPFVDHSRGGDVYGESNFYGGSRRTYDPRDWSPPTTYNQSYDRRHPSPTELHLPPSSSYRSHFVDRPALSSLPQLKRPELPPMIDHYGMTNPHSAFNSEPDSALTAHSDRSLDSDFWASNSSPSLPHVSVSVSPSATQQLADPPKAKKSRREKPRIELAPDQPPTTQGKPRARVYVACIQCRTRKIRCDGAKPVCHNCGRRSNGNTECNYDPVPKRRGPDKCPGARQRMARDARGDLDASRRRRRTHDTASDSGNSVNGQSALQTLSLSPSLSADHSICSPHSVDFGPITTYVRPYTPECGCHGLVHCPDLLEVSALSDNRKSSGAMFALTYNDAFEFSSMSPSSDYKATTSSAIYIAERHENGDERQNSHSSEIDTQPSSVFTRKVWWDSLLSLYHSPDSSRARALTASDRESTSHKISTDLRWVFRTSNYWFSFFHIPTFFGNFYDPVRRERMQPSLILALLAISTFFQSSEVGNGHEGRQRALRFRDEAQSALEASFGSGWVDETLAQAAWLLALFEVCSHPRHSSERSTSAMVMLDSIIRSLSLTMVDADDPATTMFPPGSVPIVNSPGPQLQHRERTTWFPGQPLVPDSNSSGNYAGSSSNNEDSGESSGCSCNSMTLGEHWPSASEHAPMWGPTPAWDEAWSEGEVRKESCRRLCWSSMILAAGHISYTIAHRSQGLDLFISDPANYALLFSGESVARSPSLLREHSSKDTIWALHDRAFLLWHGCIRTRNDNRASDTEKAHFAVKAWLEADALEQALNKHTCSIERAFIFQARECIFNTRMCISYEFQRYVPLVSADVNGLFHRNKAEEWLTHQATVAQRFMLGLHTITGNLNNLLARRPFFVFWFMGQISRALSLWQCDNTLTVALDVCKALLPAIDYLTALWPSPEQRLRYEVLRDRLDQACYAAGVSLPAPPNLTPSSPGGLI